MPHFELITELQTLTRRDFPFADAALGQPNSGSAVIDGEWLELDANQKLTRDANIVGIQQAGGTKDGLNPMVFPVHTEKGRYDVQAISKGNVIFLGQYEAETDVCAASITQLGATLTVADVAALFGATRRALAVRTEATANIVGYVSKIISTTRIRFIHMATYRTQ